MTSVSDAIGFLKTKSAYAGIFANSNENSLHRGEIEKMLTNAIYTDFQSIYRFATIHQRKILDLYFRRYEIGLLKTCMRMVFDHRDVELNFDIFKDFFEKHSDINLTALSNCKTLDEFVSLLKGSIYYRPLSLLSGLSEPTLWDYEMALDLCYFKWFWDSRKKVLTRDEERIFMDDYGVKMDLLNIRWIYRSKHFYNMSNADVYAHLIGIQYRLQTSQIKEMVEAATTDELTAAIRNTYYGRQNFHWTMPIIRSVIVFSVRTQRRIHSPLQLSFHISMRKNMRLTTSQPRLSASDTVFRPVRRKNIFQI